MRKIIVLEHISLLSEMLKASEQRRLGIDVAADM